MSHARECAVLNEVRAALRASSYRELDELECRVVNGSIVLSGAVASYYLKQKAQSIVTQLATGWQVTNELTVRGAGDGDGG
jgi:hypothetical protein